jgi:capsular exopolysaccharide synthesis family protein
VNNPDNAAAKPLADYTGFIRRRRWLIAITTLVCLLAAGAITKEMKKSYTATATVLAKPIVEDPFSSSTQSKTAPIDLDTEAQVVTSTSVAEIADKAIHSGLAMDKLAKNASVTVPANSSVMQIAYTASSPAKAQVGANAFANAYLTYKRDQAQASMNSQVTAIKSDAASTTKQLQDVTGQLATLPANSPNRPYAASQQNVLQNHLQDLSQQLSTLAATPLDPGTIIAAANLPKHPSSPSLTMNFAIGLMAGLLLGLILALVRDRTDKRLRGSDELEKDFQLPLLAEIALPNRRQGTYLVPSGHALGEPYRRLRNLIMSATPSDNGAVVTVAGAEANSAVSLVASNLAATMARAGLRVVLVSVGGPKSITSGLLGLSAGRGLSEILQGSATLGDIVQRPTVLPSLAVMPAGESPQTTQELLQGPRMSELLTTLRKSADYVVVEAPPTVAEAQSLAVQSDTTVLVTVGGQTRRAKLADLQIQMDQVRAALLGVVVVEGHLPNPNDVLQPPALPESTMPSLPAPVGRSEA